MLELLLASMLTIEAPGDGPSIAVQIIDCPKVRVVLHSMEQLDQLTDRLADKRVGPDWANVVYIACKGQPV